MRYQQIKIKKAVRLFFLRILRFKVFRILPDETYLRLKYRLTIGRNLRINNPITFNEKIQWMKINDKKNDYTKYVDKYSARRIVAELIGEQYLIPLLGIYNKFDEIDFNVLPDKFVLKPNHTSGDIFICTDKSKLDLVKLRKTISKWMKTNYFWLHREYVYKKIKPLIICEKYMHDDIFSDLLDYKFFCFNGKTEFLFVASNRNSKDGLNVDFYDLGWNKMPLKRYYPNNPLTMKKPLNFEKMISLTEKLALDFPFVRLDFYEVNNKIYFGEFTFYPGSGFEEFTPEKYDYQFGNMIKL